MGIYGKRRRKIVWLKGAFIHFNYNQLNGPGIWPLHSGPGGQILGKWEVRWFNVSGILLRTRNTQTFLYFRRRPSWERG